MAASEDCVKAYNLSAQLQRTMHKLAYSRASHGDVLNHLLPKDVSDDVRHQITSGSVGADSGLRSSVFPWTDPLHALPSSMSNEDLNEYIGKRVMYAAKNTAHGLANRDESALAQGFGDYGQALHTVMDRAAHRNKPSVIGVEVPTVRGAVEAVARVIPGYGGQIPAALEHEHIKRRLEGHARLDRFEPDHSSIDAAALDDAKKMRGLFESEVHRHLEEDHGLTTDKAQERIRTMYQERISPENRQKGDLARAGEYGVHELTRAARALRPLVLGGMGGRFSGALSEFLIGGK